MTRVAGFRVCDWLGEPHSGEQTAVSRRADGARTLSLVATGLPCSEG